MLLPDIFTITTLDALATVQDARTAIPDLDGADTNPDLADAAYDHLDRIEDTIMIINATI